MLTPPARGVSCAWIATTIKEADPVTRSRWVLAE
jgi:hypothetical protein